MIGKRVFLMVYETKLNPELLKMLQLVDFII